MASPVGKGAGRFSHPSSSAPDGPCSFHPYASGRVMLACRLEMLIRVGAVPVVNPGSLLRHCWPIVMVIATGCGLGRTALNRSANAGGALSTGGIPNQVVGGSAGGTEVTGGAGGSGGVAATGGLVGHGGLGGRGGVTGLIGSGGATPTGGVTSSGGVVGTGGEAGKGGTPVSGGRPVSGGTTAASGGVVGPRGGTLGSGGTVAAGGSLLGSGGATDAGGAKGLGGVVGAGGMFSMGGASWRWWHEWSSRHDWQRSRLRHVMYDQSGLPERFHMLQRLQRRLRRHPSTGGGRNESRGAPGQLGRADRDRYHHRVGLAGRRLWHASFVHHGQRSPDLHSGRGRSLLQWSLARWLLRLALASRA